MGRATRWFKGLFGLKTASKDRQRPAAGTGGSGRETHFFHNPATIPPNITPAEASWLSSYYPDSKDEAARNKHAIAVAAATASAADAAIAAAQAAAQVVRLTAQGRSLSRSKNNLLGGSCRRHNWAAVRIQSNFRAHLARKALRALKGLVKIQALVRGYLVRKHATATLRSMQALIRAQANVRSKRAFVKTSSSTTWSESFSASSTLERDTPKVVEVDSGHAWPGPNLSFSAQFAPVCTRHCCHHPDSGSTTTQTTPRSFPNPCPVTPTKGRPGEGDIHGGWETHRLYYEYPSYVAKTVSFKAKVRSQSAPKQRSEGHKKRMSLSGVMEGRSSVGMQRTSSHADHEVANFRNAVMCRLQNSHFSSYN